MTCAKQTIKKYRDRPSPPYPAQECVGKTKKGNDGLMYTSVPNVNGIYTWKRKQSGGGNKAPAAREWTKSSIKDQLPDLKDAKELDFDIATNRVVKLCFGESARWLKAADAKRFAKGTWIKLVLPQQSDIPASKTERMKLVREFKVVEPVKKAGDDFVIQEKGSSASDELFFEVEGSFICARSAKIIYFE